MQSKNLLTALLLGAVATLPSLGYLKKLETAYLGGNLSSGNMFDVKVKRGISRQVAGDAGITIREFNIHTEETLIVGVEVYTKPDSHSGFEQDDASWFSIGDTTVEGKGAGLETKLPEFSFLPVVIFEDSVQAFYITLTTPYMLYTNGLQFGSVYASNDDLAILEGVGVSYAFGAFYSPRTWNGAIFYSDGTDEIIYPTGSPSESRNPTSTPTLSFIPTLSISPTKACFDDPDWLGEVFLPRVAFYEMFLIMILSY